MHDCFEMAWGNQTCWSLSKGSDPLKMNSQVLVSTTPVLQWGWGEVRFLGNVWLCTRSLCLETNHSALSLPDPVSGDIAEETLIVTLLSN
jgi:hypothetical protein